MAAPRLCLSVLPVSAGVSVPALCDALKKAFPGQENAAYIAGLCAGVDSVAAVRLSALFHLTALIRQAGHDPTGLTLHRDGEGRPYVTDPSGTRPFDFNLSHTRAHTACALLFGGGCVGVDIEEPLPPARAEALARRFCSAGEREAMVDGRADFTAIWTIREALGKQAGRGRPLDFDAAAIPPHVRVLTARLAASGTALSLCVPCGIHRSDISVAGDSLPVAF